MDQGKRIKDQGPRTKDKGKRKKDGETENRWRLEVGGR
jgi:hypothetical protein